jgi:uncharacterized protein (DUF433 family)
MVLAIRSDPAPLSLGEDGVIRVVGTRVTLEVVVAAFDTGATPEEIVQQYPSLTLATAYGVLAYALAHRADVDAYVARRNDVRDQVRAENEQRFPSVGIRERLLARRPPSGP